MELWIRSQDRELLIKISSVFAEYNGDVEPNIHTYRISGDKCVELGIYKTKERALEVLDEIQKFIIREDELSYVQSAEGIEIQSVTERGIVYEMPQE